MKQALTEELSVKVAPLVHETHLHGQVGFKWRVTVP